MGYIDDTWLRRAHQALKAAFEVDSTTRRDMIQFLFDEGFWNPVSLKWESAISRFNDCLNPAKEQYFKLGEVWALMLRFERPQLLQAMADSMGYELRVIPTEARRQALLEQIAAAHERQEQLLGEFRAEIERLCAGPAEPRLPSLPGQRPQFSFSEAPVTAVERIGCP